MTSYASFDLAPFLKQFGEQLANLTETKAIDMMKKFKTLGNEEFVKKDYADADVHYRTALAILNQFTTQNKLANVAGEMKVLTSQILTNRAACLFETKQFQESLNNAWFAAQADATFYKAYYRAALANVELGLPILAMYALIDGLQKCTPPPTFRYKMIIKCMEIGIQAKPNPQDLMKYNEWSICWLKTLEFIETKEHWRYVVKTLSIEQNWRILERIFLVDKPQNAKTSAVESSLGGLVKTAEKVNEDWCDRLTMAMFFEGARLESMAVNHESPIFGALRLGLAGGQFHTLSYLLEHVVRDPMVKNAVNTNDESMLDIVQKADVPDIVKSRARTLLNRFGVGSVHAVSNSQTKACTDPRVLTKEANKLHKEGDRTGAIALYTKAIDHLGTDFGPQERAIIFYNRSSAFKDLSKLKSAIADLRKACELHPTYLKAYRRLADLYEQTLSYRELAETMSVIYKLTPDIEEKNTAFFKLVCIFKFVVSQDCERILLSCQPTLDSWKSAIENLFDNKEWEVLLSIFLIDDEQQGCLAKYRADNVSLQALFLVSHDEWRKTNCALIIILLERGAPVESLIRGCGSFWDRRPVSLALVFSFMLVDNALLDYLLNRGEEKKEPGYPIENDAFHQFLRGYRKQSMTRRYLIMRRVYKECTRMVLAAKHDKISLLSVDPVFQDPNSTVYKFLMREAVKLNRVGESTT